MQKKEIITYFIFLGAYIGFAIFNYIRSSQWIYDNIFAIIILTLFIIIGFKLQIGVKEIIFLNIALLVHNIGMFGFYSSKIGILEYDSMVHLVGSFIGVLIVSNIFIKELCKGEEQNFVLKIIRDHRIVMIFLFISIVIFFGTAIELIEYFGYGYLGYGEGLFFAGAGDSDKLTGLAGQYIDTMNDTVANVIGAIVGLIYFLIFSVPIKSKELNL